MCSKIIIFSCFDMTLKALIDVEYCIPSLIVGLVYMFLVHSTVESPKEYKLNQCKMSSTFYWCLSVLHPVWLQSFSIVFQWDILHWWWYFGASPYWTERPVSSVSCWTGWYDTTRVTFCFTSDVKISPSVKCFCWSCQAAHVFFLIFKILQVSA